MTNVMIPGLKFPKVIFSLLVLLAILCSAGCGRYIAPVSPDVLIATPVQELTAVVDPQNNQRVVITWLAPEKDMRGKLLSEIKGYSVQALAIRSDGTEVLSDKASDDTFEEVAFIPDTYLAALKAKQDEAEARGDIVRRVKVTREQRTFSFTEPSATTGTVMYRVRPVNAEGGEGVNDKIVQVSNTPAGERTVTLLDQVITIR